MGLFGSTPAASSPQDRIDIDHLSRRVAVLEAAVQRLQGQLAATPVPSAVDAPIQSGEPAFMGEVRGLVAQGKKINAIKVYREQTGVGLKEAKDAVELLF